MNYVGLEINWPYINSTSTVQILPFGLTIVILSYKLDFGRSIVKSVGKFTAISQIGDFENLYIVHLKLYATASEFLLDRYILRICTFTVTVVLEWPTNTLFSDITIA